MAKKNTTEIDDEARRVAVQMLSEGLVTPSEVARLAGVSRQVVDYWISASKVDHRRTRSAHIAKEWRKRLSGR